MPVPPTYVLPSGGKLRLRDAHDPILQASIARLLTAERVNHSVEGDLIILHGVGGHEGNRSVTMVLDLVELDGEGVLLLQAFLGQRPPNSTVPVAMMGGMLTTYATFGAVQTRLGEDSEEQIWLVVPMMQADLSAAALKMAIVLLAAEADFLDDVVAATWNAGQ